MRSQTLLDSFVNYCQEHPEERFWQALRNWCGWSFVLVTQKSLFSDFPKVKVSIPLKDLDDTFYWEENKPPKHD
jgi:hypothetical protein